MIKAEKLPRDSTLRCNMTVDSTSTGDWFTDPTTCSRKAKYKMANYNYCPQHAGKIALFHVMGNQDK